MSVKEQIIKEKLENSGIFSFEEVYSYAYTWFKDQDFSLVEEKYNEKVSGNSRDIKFEWTATRSFSDYFKLEIKVEVEVEGLVEIEVEIDGKKKKSNKGKIKFEFKGSLVSDPNNKWEATPFYVFIRDLYSKYIIPARTGAAEEKVKGTVMDLKEKLKEFLELTGKR